MSTPTKRVAFNDDVKEIPRAESNEPTLADRVFAMPWKPVASYEPTLLSAAAIGDYQLAENLLHSNCAELNQVNQVNKHQWTPLMYAAQKGYREVSDLLLAHGADYRMQNDKGQTALMLAASWGHSDVVDLLLEYDQESREDATATNHGKCELPSYADMKDNDGRTALQTAQAVNHEACVDLLLPRGGSSTSAGLSSRVDSCEGLDISESG